MNHSQSKLAFFTSAIVQLLRFSVYHGFDNEEIGGKSKVSILLFGFAVFFPFSVFGLDEVHCQCKFLPCILELLTICCDSFHYSLHFVYKVHHFTISILYICLLTSLLCLALSPLIYIVKEFDKHTKETVHQLLLI